MGAQLCPLLWGGQVGAHISGKPSGLGPGGIPDIDNDLRIFRRLVATDRIPREQCQCYVAREILSTGGVANLVRPSLRSRMPWRRGHCVSLAAGFGVAVAWVGAAGEAVDADACKHHDGKGTRDARDEHAARL